jgi:hypothetical protein
MQQQRRSSFMYQSMSTSVCICAQHSLFSVECAAAAAFASMNHIIAPREKFVCCCVLHCISHYLQRAPNSKRTTGELQFAVPGNLMKVGL